MQIFRRDYRDPLNAEQPQRVNAEAAFRLAFLGQGHLSSAPNIAVLGDMFKMVNDLTNPNHEESAVIFDDDDNDCLNGEPLSHLGPYTVCKAYPEILRWEGNLIERILKNKPLPDVEKLNDAVPRSEWGTDFNGNPRSIPETLDLRIHRPEYR